MKPRARDEEVRIPTKAGRVKGDLLVPEGATGLVLFAHGSGSSRLSSRNRFVAQTLRRASLGTLLTDLLTLDEEAVRENVFDIDRLASRVLDAAAWVETDAELSRLPLGLFGASTGAAAALVAAARHPGRFGAVVSRGGRPDLAGSFLPRVEAPTLLLVGGNDDAVLELNERALAELECEKALSVVPGATHLFEEPGTLEDVARQARVWFTRHLGLNGAKAMAETGRQEKSPR